MQRVRWLCGGMHCSRVRAAMSRYATVCLQRCSVAGRAARWTLLHSPEPPTHARRIHVVLLVRYGALFTLRYTLSALPYPLLLLQAQKCNHTICMDCARDLVKRNSLTPALCPCCRRIISSFKARLL